MRRMIDFDCAGDHLAGTIDEAAGTTGLLIVGGGNEIRSGAYAGQAAMASYFAHKGYPVFRYDRRGVGDSEGTNGGFEGSKEDIAAAVTTFRQAAPHIRHLVAFGNCDAATALALFHAGSAIDTLILANPWVIEPAAGNDAPAPPSAAAIRARYWARLKNPRSLLDLLTGKIDFGKLVRGLAKAARTEEASGLAQRLAAALSQSGKRACILIAARDTTAMAFMGCWKGALFDTIRTADHISLASLDTASHSFADVRAKEWLYAQIAEILAAAERR
jgi:exosortase A-associated hydrolase 1